MYSMSLRTTDSTVTAHYASSDRTDVFQRSPLLPRVESTQVYVQPKGHVGVDADFQAALELQSDARRRFEATGQPPPQRSQSIERPAHLAPLSDEELLRRSAEARRINREVLSEVRVVGSHSPPPPPITYNLPKQRI